MNAIEAADKARAISAKRDARTTPMSVPVVQNGLSTFMDEIIRDRDRKERIRQNQVERVNFENEMAGIKQSNQGFNELGQKVGYLPGSGVIVGENNSFKSKASRNNNPGNITGMGGKLLYGASGIARSNTGDKGDRAQLVFNSPQDGWNAMRKLMSSERYNSAPIRQSFRQYQTDQNAYANILKEYQRKGINVDNQTFNSLTPELQNEFMKTRARFEGYRGVGPV